MHGSIEMSMGRRAEPASIVYFRERTRPRYQRIEDGRGGWRGRVIMRDLVVDVYSYCGDGLTHEFTHLDCVHLGLCWHAAIQRFYPRPWLTRLARRFGGRVVAEAGKIGDRDSGSGERGPGSGRKTGKRRRRGAMLIEV